MLIVVAVIAAPLVAQQPTPKRDVRDPGVVATGQRVTPAGVQTVFDGRVGGVRFGETSDEVWAAVPGSVYRLAWRANRVLARARVDGRTGIYSLGIDPATHRVLASSVGRLPVIGAAPPGRRPSVAQLSIFDANASGDSASAKFNSGALGDYMAGAPAVAARSGADGRRLAVVPLPANDSLVVLDAETAVLRQAVDAVLLGELWIRRGLVPKLVDSLAAEREDVMNGTTGRFAVLTPREIEIARLIGQGASNKRIARQLSITERTVKAHLTMIFRKTGVEDRVKLALMVSRRH